MKSQKKNSNSSKPVKVPMRTCIGTGLKLPKSQMIRLVRLPSEDGFSVVVDESGKQKGRGANLSVDIDAFESAIKKKAISRHLQLGRSLTDSEIKKLRADFTDLVEKKKFRQGKKSVTFKIKKFELEKKLS